MSTRRTVPIVVPLIEPESCSLELRKRLLLENPLFESLAPADLAAVDRSFSEHGFEAGERIVREGEEASRLHIVVRGIVKLSRVTESGGSVLIDILTTGEYFGSIAGYGPGHYEDTATARSGVCTLSIRAVEFRAILLRHSSVALKAVETLSDRLRFAYEMVRRLGGYSAEARVAYVLLRLAGKLGVPWKGGSTLIQAPLTREELASMAATTTETASRVVSRLHKKRIVESGRGWLAVTDHDTLRMLVPDFRA